jgi:hypothetical protein
MLRKLTKFVCLILGLTAAQHAGAFTLWGPLETWQTADLDYGLRFYYENIEIGTRLGYVENGGPKNFGEGSRLATPIVTYGFDDTFLEYFGAQGVAAVDSAMQVLNALPSGSSANLANFLTDGAQQINYTAQALELMDLKSSVLWLMATHMGLLGETHVWDLLLRSKYGTPTCAYEYFVVNRNYDPVDYDPTPYVNGRLYGYGIWDGCSVGVNVGDAIEVPADTTATRYTAVATGQGLQFGGYYLNMTRDDMGGLQFLYNKDYYTFQGLDLNSVVTPSGGSGDTWEAVNTTNAIGGGSNFVGLLGGVEKITFVKVNFDSLLNPGFTPVTYHYTMPVITNSRLSHLSVTRTITAPDVIFTAANLIVYGGIANYTALNNTGTFILSTYLSPGISPNGTVTPSTIDPPMIVTLNNVGPIYYGENPGFMDSSNYLEYPISNWGTFDGTTNPPIVYPDGFSLAELEAELLEGGTTAPLNPWIGVLNPNATNTTATTGGGGGVIAP